MAEKELLEIELDQPMMTNGEWIGTERETLNGRIVHRFTGKAQVTKEVFDDLTRRQKEWRNYKDSLHQDNGNMTGGNLGKDVTQLM